MKKRGLCFALVFLLALFCASCSSSVKAQEEDHPAARAEQQAPAAERVFETEDGLLQVTADESWEQPREDLGIQDASLTLSKGGDAYMALISEYRWNFPMDLAGYSDMVLKQMKDHISRDEAGKTEEISLGEYEALRTDVTGYVGEEEEHQAYRICCAQAGDCYVQLIFWCPADKREDFGEEFDRIAESLLLTQDAAAEETAE